MLPDVPSLKANLRKRIVESAQDSAKQRHEFVNSLGVVVQHEGNKARICSAEGFEQVIEFQLIETSVDTHDADGIPLGPESIMAGIDAALDQIEEFKGRLLFNTLHAAIDGAGNAICAGGSDLTQELWLQAIDRMHLDFDSDDKPIYPTLVAHPDMRDRFIKKFEEWDMDTAFLDKWKKLIEQKHEEWRDRENSRKLVD